MRKLLIALVIVFTSCTDDDIYIINYCPRDCNVDHCHNFTKADFDWQKWQEEQNKKG
jgi:hypothetical protein